VGTNAIYRRGALDTTGGGALVENSEDVHTGFNLLAKGWTTKYVPVLLATGLSPSSLGAYFNQQHRWCSGSMSLLFSKTFWTAPVRVRSKLTFLAGMTYYVYTGLAIVIAPLPALVMVWAVPEHVRLVNYLPLIPAIVHNLVTFPRWHRCRYGPSAFRTKMLYAFAHIYAFADKARGRALQWTPTGDHSGVPARIRHVRTLALGWPLLVFALAAIGAGIHMNGPFDLAYWPVLISSGLFAAIALPMASAPLASTSRAPAPLVNLHAPELAVPRPAAMPDVRLPAASRPFDLVPESLQRERVAEHQ
jgi:cellulose synthase (UDP-forming)